MRQIGEAVDHGDGGVPRQLLDLGVVERPDHDPVHVARQHSRRVGDRLPPPDLDVAGREEQDRKSTRLNSSHGYISYAVFCLKKKKIINYERWSTPRARPRRWATCC